MRFKVNAETAVNFIRCYTYLAFSWPLPANATEFRKKKLIVMWAFSMLNSLCLILVLIYSIYKSRGKPIEVTEYLCYLAVISAYTGQALICRLKNKQIQSTIWELERFLKTAESHELEVFDKYVRKFRGFYTAVILVNCLTGLAAMIRSIFLHKLGELPIRCVYPFSANNESIKYFIYLHQLIAVIHCILGNSMDCQAGLSVWFVAAKLEFLAEKLEKTHQRTELYNFVENHQHLLRLANDAANSMSYVSFVSAGACCVVLVASCLQIVHNTTFSVKSEYFLFGMTWLVSLFCTAWPADKLMENCHLVGQAAYNGPWLDMSIEMRKNVFFILQRSQKPVVTSIGGFIPALSLAYCATFVSAAISYFMTVRVAFNKT